MCTSCREMQIEVKNIAIGIITAALVIFTIPIIYNLVGSQVKHAVLKKETNRFFKNICQNSIGKFIAPNILPMVNDFHESQKNVANKTTAEKGAKIMVLVNWSFVCASIILLILGTIISIKYKCNLTKVWTTSMFGLFLFVIIELFVIITLIVNTCPMDLQRVHAHIIESTFVQMK